MALNLERLVFEVDTTQLEGAVKKLDALATSLTKVNKPATDAAIKSEKLAKAQAETAASAAKESEATTKAAIALEKLNKIRDAGNETTSRGVSIQERQATILEFMNQGYTKGQSSVLAYAKAAGEATDEIAKILDMQRKIAGGDPFDKSLSGIKSLKNELEVLTQVEKLYAQGADLTTKQVRNLSLDRERLVQRMRQEGASIAQIQAALKSLNAEYITLATGVNKIAGAEAEMIKSRKAAAAATQYLADADAKLAAALDDTNKTLDKGATDALVKYEKALKTSGMSADEAAAKLAVAKKQFEGIADKKQADRLQYLARAISVQMGDVGISLASGMNPLLVMIQQGDQIRGAIQQAGASGKELEKAMGNAAGQIATSFMQTGQAIGGFFVNAVKSAGKAVLGFPFELMRAGFNAATQGTESFSVSMDRLKIAAIAFGKVGIVAIITTLAALGKGLYDVTMQEDTLAKQLALSGGSMGLSQTAAIAYAKSLNAVGVTTKDAISVIAEMTKQGGFVSKDIDMVTKAAIDMQRYAGVAIQDTVKEFAKMKDKPTEALFELAVATGKVAPEIAKAVAELENQGKKAEAVALAMKTLAEVNTKQVDQMKQDYSGFATFMKGIAVDISKFFSTLFDNLWYKATPDKAVQDRIEGLKKRIGEYNPLAVTNLLPGNSLKEMQTELNILERSAGAKARLADETARVEARQSMLNKLLADSDKAAERFANNAQKRDKELAIAVARNNVLISANLKTRKEAEIEYANIRNEYKDEKGPAVSVAASKDLSIIQKDYAEQLKLAEGFAKDERSVLKARYDAGLIDRADFISQDTALLQRSEQKQLDVINSFSKDYANAFGSQAQLLTEAFGKTKDADNRKKLMEDIINLGKDAKEFFDTIEDKKGAIGSAFSAREQVAILDFQKAVKASTDAYKEYSKAQDDIETNKKIDLELQDRLANSYGAEVAQIKAVAEETKRQTAAISKFTLAQEEAYQSYLKVLNDPTSSWAKIEEAGGAYTRAMINANNVISRSRVSIENAGTDAIVTYYKQEYERISNSITDAIVTALFEGGKAGSKKLRDLIIAELKKPITIVVKAVVEATLGSMIQSFVGGAGDSAAGSAVGAGGASGLAGISIGGASLAAQASAFGQGIASGFSTGASVSSMGSATSQSFNLGAQYGAPIAGVLAGVYGGRAVSGGYSAMGGASGNSAVNIGTAIGMAIAGPLGAALGGLAGGAFNRAFGTKLAGVGIEGTLGGATGFEGNRYTFEKGGLLRKDKYTPSMLEEADRSAIASDFRLIKTSILDLAKTAGFSTEAIDNFTSKFAIDLMNLSPEEATKKYKEEFAKIEESMAKAVIGTSGYRRENETNVQALVRVSTFMKGVNDAFSKLGFETYKLELGSYDAAQAFVDLYGGIDNFNKAFTFFYDNFFSESEKITQLTGELTKEFEKLNKPLPKTREEFKQMVIAAQKAGDPNLVKSLTDLQYSFAELVPAAENAKTSIVDLASGIKTMYAKFVELTGTKAELDAYTRSQVLESTDPATRAIQAYLFALEDVKTTSDALTKSQDAVTEAENRLKSARADALKSLIDTTKNFIDSLRKFSQSLLLGGLSTLTPEQKYNESRKQLDDLLKIATGSATTPQEIAKRDDALNSLQGAATSFLDASKIYNASSAQYTSDFEYVQKAISMTADALDTQVTEAQKQLQALGSIDTGISAVEKAINDLATANASYADAQMQFNKALEAAGVLRPAATEAYSSANAVINNQAALENGKIYGKNKSSIGTQEAIGFINNYVANTNAGTAGFTARGLYDVLQEWGVNSDLLATLTGYSKTAVLEWFQSQDNTIPAFAKGTNYVPSDMYAKIHEGERIIPAADNAQLMQNLSNRNETNAVLVNEIRSLRQEVVDLRNQQSKETSAIVISNIEAQQRNADQIGNAISTTSQESNWNAKVRDTVKLK